MKPDPYKQKVSRKHQAKNTIKPSTSGVKEKASSPVSVSETKDLKGTSSISIKYEKRKLPSNNFRFQELSSTLRNVISEGNVDDEEKVLEAETNRLKELVDRADETNFDPQIYFQFQSEKLERESDIFWQGASFAINESNIDTTSGDDSDDQGEQAFKQIFSLDFNSLASDLDSLGPDDKLNIKHKDFNKLMAGFSKSTPIQNRLNIPTYKPWKTLSPEPINIKSSEKGETSLELFPTVVHAKLDEDEKDLDDLLAMNIGICESDSLVSEKPSLSSTHEYNSLEFHNISLNSGINTSSVSTLLPNELGKEDDMEAWLDDMLG